MENCGKKDIQRPIYLDQFASKGPNDLETIGSEAVRKARCDDPDYEAISVLYDVSWENNTPNEFRAMYKKVFLETISVPKLRDGNNDNASNQLHIDVTLGVQQSGKMYFDCSKLI